MGLTETSGSVTMDGSEDIIVNVSTLNSHAIWLFLHNMVAGNIIEIKCYVYDTNTSTFRLYSDDKYYGVQPIPALLIPFVPTSQYKVTATQKDSTYKAITWAHEVY